MRKLAVGITTKAENPVEIKLSVIVDILKTTIALGHIDDVEEYENMTESKLRAYLDAESSESHKMMTL